MSMLKDRRDIKDEVRGAIRGPVQLAYLDIVLHELQRLVRVGEGSPSRLAEQALKFIPKTASIMQAPFGPREVDLSIVIFGLAQPGRVVVATVDRKLLELCSKNRLPSLRPKARVGLIASWMDA